MAKYINKIKLNNIESIGGEIAMNGNVTISGSLKVGGEFNTGVLASDVMRTDVMTVSGTLNSTSTDTGALIVSGGVGVAKDVWVGGTAYVQNCSVNGLLSIGSGTDEYSFPTTKGTTNQFLVVTASGDLVFTNSIDLNSPMYITDTTNSTSTDTGALIVSGGVGVAKDVWVGGTAYVQNSLVSGTTNSTSTDTGALIVSGGLGVAQDVMVGGKLYIDGVMLHSPGDPSSFFIGSENTTNTGVFNIAVGLGALLNNTTGSSNIAVGLRALIENIVGSYNIAVGQDALVENTTGEHNIALGEFALGTNTSGGYNIGLGDYAGISNTSGINNTFLGYATDGVATASNQLALGWGATTTQANQCVIGNNQLTEIRPMSDGTCALGSPANRFGTAYVLNCSVSGTLNSTTPSTGALVVSGGVGVAQDVWVGGKLYVDGVVLHTPGDNSNFYISTGGSGGNMAGGFLNTAMGYNALYDNTGGYENTAVGCSALSNNTTGIFNIAIGREAGLNNTTGSNNTFLGSSSNSNDVTASGQISIGYQATTTQANQCVIGNADLTEIRSMNTASTCSIGNTTYPFKNVYTNSVMHKFTTTSGNIALDEKHHIVSIVGTASTIITLPALSTNYSYDYMIFSTTANTHTITTSGNVIYGDGIVSSISLTAIGDRVNLISDGSFWYQM